MLQINESAIQKHIDRLKEIGAIIRVGDKGGCWSVSAGHGDRTLNPSFKSNPPLQIPHVTSYGQLAERFVVTFFMVGLS